MQSVPLTILNGFLGAGKTTLLKNLLMQSHQQQLAVSVVVNDMSELDVDGVLIANTEIVAGEKNNFISVSADDISSPSGIAKLSAALDSLLEYKRPDHIFLETSGSSHPLPLLRLLRDRPQFCLKGLLSLMDAVMLNEDYAAGSALLPRWQNNLAQQRRGVENLLAEQMLFCSHLFLTRVDRLTADNVQRIAHALHPINPSVGIVALPWGNLSLNDVLQMPAYDFHRVALLMSELEQEVEQQPTIMVSRVLSDDRPFHPQRLWDTYHQYLGEGIYRSKGFFWLAGRDDLALLWNQAAGSISLEFISYWKAGILQHENSRLNAEERQVLQRQLAAMPGRFGDRRCRLTVIGQQNQVDQFCAELQRCFLNEDEISWWQNGGKFSDPWPKTTVRMAR